MSALIHPYYEAVRKSHGPAWYQEAIAILHRARPLLGEEAYAHLLTFPGIYPDSRDAVREAARFLCHAGLPDQGIAMLEALLTSYGAMSNIPESLIVSYLQLLMFGSPDIQTPERVYRKHVDWSRRFLSDNPYTQYANPLTINRRLKIGYTCHFISISTSLTLLQPLLKAHHRDRVEVFMYSDEPKETVSNKVRATVEHWRDTYGMDHNAFCELVRQDGIDILLELNGHGLHNRYPAIARHPAPVQVAWYNYACTTGVPGLDYTLMGGTIDIRHLQPYYSETIFYTRGGAFAVAIGNHFPRIGPLPFDKNGFITFCSFGQAHKVSRQQIHLWCEVLKRVPGSRFFMKSNVLGEAAYRAAFLHHFEDGGIDTSRLIFEGNSDYDTLLRCYERADIALDTYPYNAGTTSTEAVIQGVPVVSLIGDSFCSQLARATLDEIGHSELLCRSRQEFIDKVVALANDPARLRHYRQTLREDFRHSPRSDVDRFITEMEDGFYEMWQQYIAKHG